MYDLDPTDPWDWSDYARLYLTIFFGLLLIAGIGYAMYMYQPVESVVELCCQCCCP